MRNFYIAVNSLFAVINFFLFFLWMYLGNYVMLVAAVLCFMVNVNAVFRLK